MNLGGPAVGVDGATDDGNEVANLVSAAPIDDDKGAGHRWADKGRGDEGLDAAGFVVPPEFGLLICLRWVVGEEVLGNGVHARYSPHGIKEKETAVPRIIEP